jgi:hypothetical protein
VLPSSVPSGRVKTIEAIAYLEFKDGKKSRRRMVAAEF